MSNVAGTGSRPTATRYMTERKSSLLLHANEVFYSWQYSSHVTSTCHAAWFSLPNDFPTPPASCGPECSRTGTNTVRRNTPHTQTPFCPLLAQPRWARIRKGFRGFTGTGVRSTTAVSMSLQYSCHSKWDRHQRSPHINVLFTGIPVAKPSAKSTTEATRAVNVWRVSRTPTSKESRNRFMFSWWHQCSGLLQGPWTCSRQKDHWGSIDFFFKWCRNNRRTTLRLCQAVLSKSLRLQSKWKYMQGELQRDYTWPEHFRNVMQGFSGPLPVRSGGRPRVTWEDNVTKWIWRLPLKMLRSELDVGPFCRPNPIQSVNTRY